MDLFYVGDLLFFAIVLEDEVIGCKMRNMMSRVARLPKNRKKRLPGSRARTVFIMDKTGVIPEPAAKAANTRLAPGSIATPNRPSGRIA